MAVTEPRRRPHGYEHRVGSGHRRLEITREAQPSGCHVAGNEMVEPGLVDRHLAARQALDLCGILIDAGDLDAELREARPGNQPDIPGPDHRYAHQLAPCKGQSAVVGYKNRTDFTLGLA